MISNSYQPHIDGLRAIAVLLVIGHHLGDLFGISGGYIGVDIFFVISGYLITGTIYADLNNHDFSFGRFYRRRVIRLAPAFFTVLFVTTLAALVLMLPEELIAYFYSSAFSSLFLTNFYMWREVGGYFNIASETTPLLHLWSLAIEEQFYFFLAFCINTCSSPCRYSFNSFYISCSHPSWNNPL
jgi:peptidoglycan/LPS O-acetylase OafA/YrhL